jgi:dipeptidyl aminopeptidase/acylaminoacyl peptidase
MVELNKISIIKKVNKLSLPEFTKVEQENFPKRIEQIIERSKQVNCFAIDYLSNGHLVKGFVVEPIIGENLPCIIYNRGGSKDFGKLELKSVYSNLALFASWGFVVIASQYSGNDGGQGKDECGGKDVYDIIILKEILEYYERADASKIGMYGVSRGGMMTYLCLAKVDWIKSAVIKAGSSNEIRGYQLRPDLQEWRRDMYDTYSDEENKKRSAMFWTDKLCKSSPILLLHGTGDDKVSVFDTLEIAPLLYNNKIPFEMLIFEGDNHRLSINHIRQLEATRKWFDKYLK